MTWIGPGRRVLVAYPLTDERDPVVDAQAFLDSGARSFRVDCPACGLVMAQGRAGAAA